MTDSAGLGESHPYVHEVKLRLAAFGVYHGTVDDAFTDDLWVPLVWFQDSLDLQASRGRCDSVTVAELDTFEVVPDDATGQATFDAEGNDSGHYFSRVIHWPGYEDGKVIGRRY